MELSSNIPPWIHTITGSPRRAGVGSPDVQVQAVLRGRRALDRFECARHVAPVLRGTGLRAPGRGRRHLRGFGPEPGRVAYPAPALDRLRRPEPTATERRCRVRHPQEHVHAVGDAALHRSMCRLDQSTGGRGTTVEGTHAHDAPPRVRTGCPGLATIVSPLRTGDHDLTRRSHIDCPRAGAGPLAGSPRARARFHGGPSTRPSNIDRVDANQYPGSRDGADSQRPQSSNTVGCAGGTDL